MSDNYTGSTTWVPSRGDYGAYDATELIDRVEAGNCTKGCLKSGTAADRREFGPGGNCDVLAMLFSGEAVPQLDPTPRYPTCRVREPLPTSFEEATRDMDPLFPAPTAVSS